MSGSPLANLTSLVLDSNFREVQAVCNKLLNGIDPAEKQCVLEAQDSNGFTALLHAAAKGLKQIAEKVRTKMLHH